MQRHIDITQFNPYMPDDLRRMDTALSDAADNLGDDNVGIGLRANGAGIIMVDTLQGGSDNPRTVSLGAGESVALLFTRVRSTGTTATGIDAFTVRLDT